MPSLKMLSPWEWIYALRGMVVYNCFANSVTQVSEPGFVEFEQRQHQGMGT